MSPETTDKVIGDTNSYLPRVLQKGVVTSFTQVAISSRYKNTASVTTKVLASNNPLVDCYLYTSGGGTSAVILMNHVTDNPDGSGFSESAHYYLDSTTSNGKVYARINIEIVKSTSTSPQAVYYVVYSTGFSDGAVL